MEIIKNVTKEKIENRIGQKLKYSFEFQPEWNNSRCKIEETEKEFYCSYYGIPTKTNKVGWLGSINYLK